MGEGEIQLRAFTVRLPISHSPPLIDTRGAQSKSCEPGSKSSVLFPHPRLLTARYNETGSTA
jgi:hypothetical protein